VGAEDVIVTDMNYDDTVRLAAELAEKNGWMLTQDTAWEGYEEIPRWITQGYTTMGAEMLEQLRLDGVENRPIFSSGRSRLLCRSILAILPTV
jgi:diaminopropionate ammonia-lyase